MPHTRLQRSYVGKSIYVALCKSDLVLDYSIKLHVPEKFEGDIPIELQKILRKDLWDKRKKTFMGLWSQGKTFNMSED